MIRIVKLGADWCSPCRIMKPTIIKLQEKYVDNSNIQIEDINIEEDTELATEYGVRSIPTTLIFQNDVLVDKKVGILKFEQLDEIINNYQNEDRTK